MHKHLAEIRENEKTINSSFAPEKYLLHCRIAGYMVVV
jgi:hypothetical protein